MAETHESWRNRSALTLAEAVRALGGEPLGRDGVLAPGPGHSLRDRSLRVWLDPTSSDGFRVHSFAGDDPLKCRDHVRDKLGLSPRQRGGPTAPPPSRVTDAAALDDARQREKAQWWWAQTQPARGTLGEEYLAFRGLSQFPETLRYLRPRPPRYPYPTLVAAFAMPQETEPGQLSVSRQDVDGIHLTFLRPDGRGKAGSGRDKIMIGPSMGKPIVLAPMNDNLGLAITEGIEDALSIHLATGLGAWAAGCASRMPALAGTVPDYLDLITIAADGDASGRKNAVLLAERLSRRGLSVEIHVLDADLRDAS
jgi:Toprim domain